ncbi:DNA polymerase I [Bacteriophage DSS3_VP1]|uniref:DNA polymerase n=1 Tax=Bacteriophage DSS3_VP1 TaxID=2664196 RepID=A0A7S5FQB9_9CAUD|nr:DNA polymerase I [Bacteriophage DSS3_VP1]QGH74636.1 DNA polymerase [Bacteriophage DSS3_VP1]
MTKKRCVFDTEFDGFLRYLTQFHCAGIIDADTEEEFWFLPWQFQEFLDKLEEYDIRAAHNGSGYDEKAIEIYAKMQGIDWKADPDKFVDTLIMSQVLNYKRFNNLDANYKEYMRYREGKKNRGENPGKLIMAEGHSLGRWGIFFKDFKGEFTDFSVFTPEMFDYMKQDVRLGLRIYLHLIDELKEWIRKAGDNQIIRAIQIETDMNRVTTEQHINGWRLDKEKLPEVVSKIEARMQEIADDINPRLGKLVRKKSGDKKGYDKKGEYAKQVKFTKSGQMDHHTRKWFDLPDDATVKNNYGVVGDYCRVEFEDADLGNTEAVKSYLYKLGWVPDEYNGKWDEDEDGKRFWRKTSAKITESSLEHLEGAGAINEFYTLRSRKSIIEGWSEYIDDEGRLHGDAFNIGTPTFRQTHSIIVNLPSGKATLGPEIRGLFVASEGWQIVSADSAACQLRLLSHYMKDDDFLKELLDGDMHQKNADILTAAARKVLKDQGITIPRPDAKPFIFAFLYGAGGPKLSRILGLPEHVGNKLKDQFQAGYPRLDKLIKRVKSIVKNQGFIIGLDSRPIYCESQHKALNYLIQGAEAVVMKATVAMLWRRLKEENIPHRMLLFYHDEMNFEVPQEYVERAREITMECFAEAPKEFGVDIMVCGDCIAGNDYYEVH